MDGIIVINKEKGYTSNDVVQIIKKIFKEKVGHTGTLDPIATGVLPILIGKGTKCSKYLINHDKIYTATLKLGIKTDTGDITGNIIEKKDIDYTALNIKNINDIFSKMIGEIEQIPPMYSAIKINGKKLYEYARNGQIIDVKPRKIEIYDLKLLELKKDEIKFRVYCSKGTYIRTLCEDIAEKLKTYGTMTDLNREQVGDFSIEQSITIDELKKSDSIEEKYFFNIEKIFCKFKKITLNERSFIAFINGVKLFTDEPNGIYRIYDKQNVFLGIGLVNSGILKRDIIIY